MLTEDFLSVAVQTVWMVAFGVAHRAGADRQISQQVIPTLRDDPPVANRSAADPKISACIRKLEPYVTSSGPTDRERLAVFYLSVLAEDPDEYWRSLAILPTAAWRARPSLISPAY